MNIVEHGIYMRADFAPRGEGVKNVVSEVMTAANAPQH